MTTPSSARPFDSQTPVEKPSSHPWRTAGRFLLGLPMVVFGLNAFLNFIPQPKTPLAPGAVAFIGALANSGYMLQLIGLTQLVSGLMLVTNLCAPLALVLLAPFFVNSLAFHLVLEHSGLPMALVFTALELALAWSYRRSYATVVAVR